MKACPKCNSQMVLSEENSSIAASAVVVDSLQIPTASGVAPFRKYNYVCNKCGHVEVDTQNSETFHS